MNKQNGTIAVLTILLGLIVKSALDSSFKPIFDADGGLEFWPPLSWAQLAVFFLLTLRFYLGAIRFVNTEPQKIDFLVKVLNFIFSFLLFCAFYAISLSVMKPAYFYPLVVALHVVDATWFSLAIGVSYLTSVPATQLRPDEIPIEAIRAVMWKFLVFSILTIVIAFFLYGNILVAHPQMDRFSAEHGVFLAFLVAISLIDFAALFEYYFRFETWTQRQRQEFGVT